MGIFLAAWPARSSPPYDPKAKRPIARRQLIDIDEKTPLGGSSLMMRIKPMSEVSNQTILSTFGSAEALPTATR